MLKKKKENATDLMDVLGGLAQVMRSCCRDEAFCEGVTFHQFMILDAVAREKELPMADLHKLLAVEKSTTTRLVNPLIRKGLVTREMAAHDSRAIKLVLTVKGRETHQKVQLCLADFFQRALGNMSEKKRTDVLQSVKIFITAVKNSSTDRGCC
ncbi:MAG: winged helix-turn-helix transcriptional regulator [Smithella sp.]|nr:winged helix-turn-helix transcriptional regulator [Smithella sp.]HOU50168.1 MarR family winged helix-turn-helix transcriptional regulator [Smithella sp.]HQG64350.1 MarR family winged helix-turn-helix transcriptional regulator [Smithella sp.]HQH15686.1 MarR family winged helix-turn-helix transcriptional regulator [Smithella sp.]HQI72264.1 MarR family winged helix-turn-helix transcriptional regulator [Smithella sp.]